ncbi:alpha/beta hydrolase [Polluticoccus soli]|uniref:alpha/beta hydrolase n=1 Tax=Polluticoccus soli TaxID=3034150 RepID=UPI0023E32166|nr:alpha/beta hydrolase [Flavipsychrobacter sp. JY13-12]
MGKIYCLSGIGADDRIFGKLSIPGYELVHLAWIKPERKETLPQYALRIAKLIDEENPIILGLSFGGMLCTEIAKALPVKKAFLISSAKTKLELPKLNRAVQALIRSQILPPFVFSIPNRYICKIFGAETADEIRLLNGIIRDADGAFVKWASRAIVEWHNEVVPPNIIHIHGTNDHVLPSAISKPDYWIDGGTHLMVYSCAGEVSTIIAGELSH